FRLPCTPLRLIVRPLVAAALPPVLRLEDDWLGVVDSAPRPSEEADVPPVAALPLEPTTPLELSGVTEPAPVPIVDADPPGPAALPPEPIVLLELLGPAAAPPCAAIPVAAEPATNIAVSAIKANRLTIIFILLNQPIPYRRNSPGTSVVPVMGAPIKRPAC